MAWAAADALGQEDARQLLAKKRAAQRNQIVPQTPLRRCIDHVAAWSCSP